MLATVPPIKTPLGHQELRRRTGGLGQRHRTLLFLIDGRRPLSEVLMLGHKAGAATSHLEDLVRLGFVDLPALHPAPPAQQELQTQEPVPAPAQITYLELEVPASPPPMAASASVVEAGVPAAEAFDAALLPRDGPIERVGKADDGQFIASVVAPASGTAVQAVAGPGLDPVAEPILAPALDAPVTPATPSAMAPATTPATASAAEPLAARAATAAVAPMAANLSSPRPAQRTPAATEPSQLPTDTPASATLALSPTGFLVEPGGALEPVAQSRVTGHPTAEAPPPPAQRRVLPPVLQSMGMLARRRPQRRKDPVEEARDCLLRVIELDRTTVARRLRPRVANAKTEGVLIDVVWALERDLVHSERSHEGLIALQRARELLQLGNTQVDEPQADADRLSR